MERSVSNQQGNEEINVPIAAMPNADQLGILTPQGGDLPQDRVARRRQQNREYSQRYRHKKHKHIINLEEKQKTLLEEITKTTSKVKDLKDEESQLLEERNTLHATFFEAASSLQAHHADTNRILYELEQMKLFEEAQRKFRSLG